MQDIGKSEAIKHRTWLSNGQEGAQSAADTLQRWTFSQVPHSMRFSLSDAFTN